jgi:hypothetical protein
VRVLPKDAALSLGEDEAESLPMMQQSLAPAAASQGLLVCDFCGRGSFVGTQGLKLHQIKTPVLPSLQPLPPPSLLLSIEADKVSVSAIRYPVKKIFSI